MAELSNSTEYEWNIENAITSNNAQLLIRLLNDHVPISLYQGYQTAINLASMECLKVLFRCKPCDRKEFEQLTIIVDETNNDCLKTFWYEMKKNIFGTKSNQPWNIFDAEENRKVESELHSSNQGERASNHGRMFFRNWIMKLLVEFIKDEEKFVASVENTDYKGFDDFVVYDYINRLTYCFQFKSKANEVALTHTDLFEMPNDKKKPPFSAIFNFQLYYEEYLRHNESEQSVSMILFTNRPLDPGLENNLLTRVARTDLSVLNKFNDVYKFVDPNSDSLVTLKTRCAELGELEGIPQATFDRIFQSFVHSFYLAVEQKYDDFELTEDIKKLIREYNNGAQSDNDNEIYNWYYKHFDSWYKNHYDKQGFFVSSEELRLYFDVLKKQFKIENIE